MPPPQTTTPYLTSINAAQDRFAKAVEAYHNVQLKLNGITDDTSGEYANASKELDAAAREWTAAEDSYQTALQLADKAATDAKAYPPANSTRVRYDTLNGTLIAITEVADGQGNWSPQPGTAPSKVDIPGITPKADQDTVTAAPTSEYVLRNGKLEKNEAYKPPTPAAGSAVPNSEYVYDASGQPVKNVAYQAPQPAPRTPEAIAADKAKARTAAADATTAEVAASNATATADVALKKAQTDADTAAQNLVNAQRAARQAPTDAQAQAAITTAQKALDLANQNLEQQIAQAKNLDPIAVQQAQATLDRSKQAIQQAQLGDLYGRPQQLQQIRDLMAAGEITPQQADAMSSALNSGTTVYQALQQAQADRTSARTQDVSNQNQLAGTFGSFASSAFNQIADMNKYATPGSSGGYDAFVSLLNMAQDRLKNYQVAPAQQTDYLSQTPSTSVGQMANIAQQQTAPPVSTAPPATEAAGHTITINIGGSGAASNPQPPTTAPQPAGVAGTPNDPRNMAVSGYQGAPNPNTFGSGVGQMADMAAAKVPAGVNDIYQAYGLDPSKRRSGMQIG